MNVGPRERLNFNLQSQQEMQGVQWAQFFFGGGGLAISWAAPAVYGGSQARGRIGAIATGLRQSHSNLGFEPCLQPIPQLTATPDP